MCGSPLLQTLTRSSCPSTPLSRVTIVGMPQQLRAFDHPNVSPGPANELDEVLTMQFDGKRCV